MKIYILITLFFFMFIFTKAQLIEHQGKEYFLCGANVPWNNYGWDFGKNNSGWGTGYGYDATWWENSLADIQKYGGNSIRVWVHCKGENNPMFDGSGTCTGLNDRFLTDLDDMIVKAKNHNVMVLLTLFDFYISARKDVVKDVTKTNAYINNALIPMVKHLSTHCNLLGYEIFNEPEWIMDVPAGDGSVTASQMQRFVGMCAEAVHNNSTQKVTVGSVSIKYNSDVAPNIGNYWNDAAIQAAYNNPKAYLDFYQIHYYDWMVESGHDWAPYTHSASYWGLDKPTIIGETGNTGHFSFQQQYDLGYSNGYAGTWPWAQSPSAGGANKWADFNNQMKTFRDNHIAEVDFACATPCTGNPPPAYISAEGATTFCSGGSVLITANTGTGYTYKWKNNGITIKGETSSTYLATKSGDITVVVSSGSCSATSNFIPITANPSPIISASNPSICSGSAINVALTSSMNNTIITWTANAESGITGSSSGSGSTINQTLINSSAASGKVIYTINSTANGCAGSTVNLVATVTPVPVVTATDASVCAGTTTNIALTSTVSGTNFTWTANASGVNGSSFGSGSSIAQTLTNSSSNAGTVIYTITPIANNCSGNAKTITATVNAPPVINGSNVNVCSGITTNIAPTSSVLGTTYSWTSLSGSDITGSSSGSGNTIAEKLISTGMNPGNVTYTVTPIANGCSGNPINIIATVNPVPVASATNVSICSGSWLSLPFNSTINSTNYTYTAVADAGISGFSSGSGSAISQGPTNTGTSPGKITYTVTPATYTCTGSPITVTATINPVPIAIASDATVCGDVTTNIKLNAAVIGTTFTWEASASGVTGAGPGSGTIIAQLLKNPNTYPGMVTYYLEPIANGCKGSKKNITITVNVAASTTLIVSGNDATICSGSAINIPLTSNVNNTTYTWSPLAEAGITGATDGNGSNITQTLTKFGSTSGKVTYVVTPMANGCPGNIKNIMVTVNPEPLANAGHDQTIETSSTTLHANTAGQGMGTWSVITGTAKFSNINDSLSNVSELSFGINTLRWTITNSCATSTNDVNIEVVDITKINDENKIENKFVLFPNPTSGIITINTNFKTDENLQIQVFDVFGKMNLQVRGENKIDLSYLPNGIYFLNIKSNTEKIIKKIIKQ